MSSIEIRLQMSFPHQIMQQWSGLALSALVILAIYQQILVFRIRRASRNREELFQIVTENAADMIALVDVKGRRLYNSPAYKRILGWRAPLGRARSLSIASATKTAPGGFWSRWPALSGMQKAMWRSWLS